jgi:hypothetical protein
LLQLTVLGDGVGEESGILRHDGDALAPRLGGVVADVLVAVEHTSRAGVVIANQEVGESRLAGSRASSDRGDGPYAARRSAIKSMVT